MSRSTGAAAAGVHRRWHLCDLDFRFTSRSVQWSFFNRYLFLLHFPDLLSLRCNVSSRSNSFFTHVWSMDRIRRKKSGNKWWTIDRIRRQRCGWWQRRDLCYTEWLSGPLLLEGFFFEAEGMGVLKVGDKKEMQALEKGNSGWGVRKPEKRGWNETVCETTTWRRILT